MRVKVSGRHMEVTEALKSHVEKSLTKVRGHFDKIIEADVVLSVEKHRHIAEMNLHANGIRIHSKESSADMYASVDAAIDKLEKQVRKYRDRINRYEPRRAAETLEYQHNIIEMAEENSSDSTPQHRVVNHERVPLRSMTVDEAAMQLELANDAFLVFSNAETNQVNVLYPRTDGTYSLIEPQF